MATDLIDISDEAKAHIVQICQQATIDERSFFCLSLSYGGNARDKSGKLVEQWSTEELSVGAHSKDSVDIGDYAPIQVGDWTLFVSYRNLVRLKDKRIERQRVGVGYPNPNDKFFWLLIPVEKNPS